MTSIHRIATECIQDAKKLNGIATLLNLCEDEKPQTAHAAITSLEFVLSHLVCKGLLDKTQKSSADEQRASWLRETRALFFALLRQRICSNSFAKLQIAALNKYLALLKSCSQHAGEFQNSFFAPLVQSVVFCEHLNAAITAKIVETLNLSDDLRFFFFKDALKLFKTQLETQKYCGNPKTAYSILSQLKATPDSFSELNLFCDASKISQMSDMTVYKRVFSDCWISFLRQHLSDDIYKAVLESLHQKLIPQLSEPVLLMDFLVDAYDNGGVTSLLALNGLFTLIIDHNLDYPDFYHKLYCLFDVGLLHVKYRSRFFRLVDLFLGSTYLPVYLVAAFVKRMARLCLFAPPSGIIIVLPLIFNLLKAHPSCIKLIHSESVDPLEDPFLFDELDPSRCNAQDSSLWEIVALKQHAIHSVAGLAKVFEDSLSKPAYDLEDFMDHTFNSMVNGQINSNKRKVSEEKPPAVSSKKLKPDAFTRSKLLLLQN